VSINNRSTACNTNDFFTQLRNIFDNKNPDKGYSFLIGDMNIDILGNMNNDYLDILAEYGYKSFVNIYTRKPLKGMNSCLYHIFIKSNKRNSNEIRAEVTHYRPFFNVYVSAK